MTLLGWRAALRCGAPDLLCSPSPMLLSICRRFTLGLVLFAAWVAGEVVAQPAADTTDSSPMVCLELRDGSSLVGQIVGKTDSTIILRRPSGQQLTFRQSEVVSREQLKGRVTGEGTFVRRDPNRTRLFFGPTARPLGSGNGYVSSFQIFVPFVAVGAGARTTLAGGTIPLPGAFLRAFYLAPKVTILNRPEASVAVGALHATVVEAGSGGLVYGVGTLGRSEAAVTVGLGFAYATGGGFNDRPALVLGGELQLSNSVKLISENYIVVGSEVSPLVSGGVRLFGSNLAGSLGLATTPRVIGETDISFPFFPVLSFAYNF